MAYHCMRSVIDLGNLKCYLGQGIQVRAKHIVSDWLIHTAVRVRDYTV